MRLRTLVVDDEPTARRRLSRFLRQSADVDVLATECGDGAAAVAAIQEHRPDLVFLDVQMPKMDGFEVLRAVGVERMPLVIFVTAYDQFALQAFEAQALDYLLKPFLAERVHRALDRARVFLAGDAKQSFQQQLSGLLRATAASHQSPCVLVRKADRVLVLRAKEIDWIEADDDYLHLHVGPESHLLRSTLTELEQRLRSEGFVRIHRSRLVNLDRIKEFRPLFRGESVVVLKDGVQLVASQTCFRDLQERLGTLG
jgi:two-component system, LytTR family, response regulator